MSVLDDIVKKRAQTEAPQPKETKHAVAILGAGPAGVGAAYYLAQRDDVDVALFERGPRVGGNSASFQIDGVWCDHGSHRFHPVAEPRIKEEVKKLLGDDLLTRPRHGRILLKGRWIHFPLKPVDLLLQLPKGFALALARDTVLKALPKKQAAEPTFATVLEQGLGPAMSEAFYFPYVEKLWGLPPSELAVTLAKKRVSGSSVVKILMKIARQIPGFKSPGAGVFHYPKKGFGQIIERFAEEAVAHGADLHLDTEITAVTRDGDKVTGLRVKDENSERSLPYSRVWSTLPISAVARMMDPPPPPQVLEAAKAIKFRGMILIYLVLETDRFTEYDAHYFPELNVPISRMSETKNYHNTDEPTNRTVLCAELPADPGGDYWDKSDEELGALYCEWLDKVGLPVKAPVVRTETRRLRFAYPVYNRDYEQHFNVLDEWMSGVEGLLTFGRQGLFAHDNTHHALAMSIAAVDCLKEDGEFDQDLWAEHRAEFETHVVED